jgi:hypothetical protein
MKKIKICAYCGDELDEEEIESPRVDGEGDIICDECYNEQCEFKCCLCRDYGNIADQHKIVVVFEKILGVEPGLYRVTNRSYWYASIVGDDGGIFPTAVQRIGNIPVGADGNGYPCGHLCAECQKKLIAEVENQ